MRTIDTEQNWYWKQGYIDGFLGYKAITPDTARTQHERSDYYKGYANGREGYHAEQRSKAK